MESNKKNSNIVTQIVSHISNKSFDKTFLEQANNLLDNNGTRLPNYDLTSLFECPVCFDCKK